MKIDHKVVLASCALGIFTWEYFAFHQGTFIGLLLTDISRDELYIRLVVMASCIAFGFICSRLILNQKKVEQNLSDSLSFQQQLLDAIPVPIFYKNEDYVYTGCNKSFEDFLGMSREEITGKTVYDIAPAQLAETYHQRDAELISSQEVQVYDFEVKSKNKGENRQVVFHKATFKKPDGSVGGLIGAILDITERKNAEAQKEELILELREALDKVKLLSGFLPICASCKNIRDDQGYWNQIETYIHEHSEVEFSHSICPKCAQKIYPELTIYPTKK